MTAHTASSCPRRAGLCPPVTSFQSAAVPKSVPWAPVHTNVLGAGSTFAWNPIVPSTIVSNVEMVPEVPVCRNASNESATTSFAPDEAQSPASPPFAGLLLKNPAVVVPLLSEK